MSLHIMANKVYYLIFGALLVLTGVTVAVAFVDLGVLNDVVAMAIAVLKASLVILFFMHVKYSSRVTKLTVAGGFIFLGIFFLLIMCDYLTRGVLLPIPGK
jgi:cytochrome c oxidase subunit IV